MATEILINYVYYKPKTQVQKELPALEDVSQQHACKRFSCTFPECSKSYTTIGWLKKHLRDMHRVNIERPTSSSQSSSHDGRFSYALAFMKVALLYRDTVYCYKMGDGDRLFRNLKLLMLHFGRGKHTKYRLWVWRMLAYDIGLLSEAERFMYK